MFSNKYLWRRYYSVCARNMMPRSMDCGTINCVSEIRQRSWMEVQWQGVTQQKVNIYFTSTDWGRRLPEYIPQTGKEVSPLLDRQGTTVIFCWNKRRAYISPIHITATTVIFNSITGTLFCATKTLPTPNSTVCYFHVGIFYSRISITSQLAKNYWFTNFCSYFWESAI